MKVVLTYCVKAVNSLSHEMWMGLATLTESDQIEGARPGMVQYCTLMARDPETERSLRVLIRLGVVDAAPYLADYFDFIKAPHDGPLSERITSFDDYLDRVAVRKEG